ncbi:MAG: hypothetical protein E7278_03050 [Lachnospiraceae bacterium]|nr:hypothetical protein [Lachnospiraceae bacterium]
MNFFITMRDQVRTFLGTYETIVERVWNGLVTLFSLLIMNQQFGYAPVLKSTWIVLAIAVLCSFVPMNAIALALTLCLMIHLAYLSLQVALVTGIMLVLSYILCRTYQAKQMYHLVGIPLFYQIHAPFILPMEAALLGNSSEITVVICGSVLSFFLRQVRDAASAITDGSMTVLDLIQGNVFANQIFYVYMFAMVTMFLVISQIRIHAIRYAWILSVVYGVSVEFVIMIAGYLLFGNKDRIPTLIVSNIIVLAVGIVTNYLFQDLDYSRIEKLQFEDDDYNYYVTAIPKIQLTEKTLEVKRITDEEASEEQRKKRRHRMEQ